MSHPRILSVGQCAFDQRTIARHLGEQFAAEVTVADTVDEALAELRGGPFDLILVNRVFDAEGTPGLDLIRSLKADPGLTGVATMLVSDLPEAQAEAVALGALPGFGKSRLRAPETRTALETVLSRAAT